MSVQRLPEQIIPYKLARQRRSLRGVLKLDAMERLAGMLADSQGDVAVDLQFGVDEQGVSYMRGRLSAQVNMVCQRCMGPVTVPVEAEVAVGFAASEEQARAMPEPYEACVVTDESALLSELIEDELILALPIVAAHPEQACQPWFDEQQEELSPAGETVAEKKNPFAVLASLKRDK